MIRRLLIFLLGILAVTGPIVCYSESSTPESSIGFVVTHPTKPGQYRNGDWEYEYSVWGDTLLHGQGVLKYKGEMITRRMGSVLNTPLGKLMSFDLLSGGQVGYNTGWLMTAFIHDTKRSNIVAPVFMPDGNINPEVLAQLPIKQTDVKEENIDDR